ncbi:hypothetical protein ACLB2K_070946 [Fragaria x ananassa]
MKELSDSELAARFLTREDLKLSFAEMFEKILVASDLADAECAAKLHPRDGMDPIYDPDKPLPEGFAWVSAFLGGTGKTYVCKIFCFHCGGKHMTDQCSIKDTPQATEFQKNNDLFVSVDTFFRRP